MPYTVLARKYRSQTFDQIIGQDPIAQTLKNAISTGRVAHAYLFAGTRGVGKTTMARILAKALNCLSKEKPTTKPCCTCQSCTAINIGEDIDVIEIDGASNNSVDQVRKLRENAIYRPARSRYKIYIIDEVHMLSTSAFNALLKILEEPPDHVKFIFATTEPNKVIPTIQSRCQRFDFSNIAPAAIAEQLKLILGQEKIKCEDDLILQIARMANGSMRDALSLLDRLLSTGSEPLTVKLLEKFLGCPSSEKIYTLVANIGDSDAAAALDAVDDLINAGLGEIQIVNALVDCMRDIMVAGSAGPDTEILVMTAQQRKKIKALAEKFDIAALVYNITSLEKLRFSVRSTDSPRALLEAAILRFTLSEHFLNVDSLLSQVPVATNKIIKKKTIAKADPGDTTSYPAALPRLNDLESIKSSWQSIQQIISTRLGPGTAILLKNAMPTGLKNGTLILSFPASAEIAKKMCESNGKVDSIQKLLNEHSDMDISIELELLEKSQQNQTKTEFKTSSQRKNEIINDPAVRAILTQFDATITRIDEQ